MTRDAKIITGIIMAVLVIGIGIFLFSTGNSGNQNAINNNSSATSSASSSQALACTLGNCPFDIYASDNGGIFSYTPTSRFTVWLDPNKYPKSNLKCVPSGIIGSVSNLPSQPGTTTLPSRFEGVNQGTCTLSDNGFSVTINIEQMPNGS